MDKSTFANHVQAWRDGSYLYLSLNPRHGSQHSPPLLLTRARSLTNFTGLVGHRSEQAGCCTFGTPSLTTCKRGATGPDAHPKARLGFNPPQLGIRRI